MAVHDDDYADKLLAVVPPIKLALDERTVIDRLVQGLKDNALVLDADDALTLLEAEMPVADADDYARGFEVLRALADVDATVKRHYVKYKAPLKELTTVVHSLESPQLNQILTLKQGLSERLTRWKQAEERRIAVETAQRQQEADDAARAAAALAAAELEAVAATVPDAQLAETIRAEAEQVRSTPVAAAPVEVAPAPKAGGHTRKTWKARIEDIDALIRAHVDGKCHLPLDVLMDALGPWMDTQAKQHQAQLPRVYPGVTAYQTESAVTPRRR